MRSDIILSISHISAPFVSVWACVDRTSFLGFNMAFPVGVRILCGASEDFTASTSTLPTIVYGVMTVRSCTGSGTVRRAGQTLVVL